MIDKLQKLGIGGILGFLVGIAMVLYIHPTTEAGAGILVAICTLSGVVISAVIKAIRSLLQRKSTQ